MSSCDGNTLSVSWHEHVLCPWSEGGTIDTIFYYSCTYECPEVCVGGIAMGVDGATAVAWACGEEPEL
jgi:hypothetical protein